MRLKRGIPRGRRRWLKAAGITSKTKARNLSDRQLRYVSYWCADHEVYEEMVRRGLIRRPIRDSDHLQLIGRLEDQQIPHTPAVQIPF